MELLEVSVLFAACAAVIVFTGTRLSYYGDVIAEHSGLGGAWIGVVALASVTSLPEMVTGASSVLLFDLPDIAAGDIVGSCMFNLLVLAGLDVASPTPLFARVRSAHVLTAAFGIILLVLTTLAILAGPVVPSLGWVGLGSVSFLLVYLVAVRAVFIHERRTGTDLLVSEPAASRYAGMPMATAIRWYAVHAVVLVGAAATLPFLAEQFAELVGLSQSFIGASLVAFSTSLPEIVVSVGAARLGAWDMAAGNVLGSNLFNIAILGIDDLLYTRGPMLAIVDPAHAIPAAAAAGMSAVVVIGLVFRPARALGRISWETIALFGLYGVATYFLWH